MRCSSGVGAHRGDKILLLVDRRDVRTICLLTYHLHQGRSVACGCRVARERTGILSGYFCRIRSASALRFSGAIKEMSKVDTAER
jgi:hypothetical protein